MVVLNREKLEPKRQSKPRGYFQCSVGRMTLQCFGVLTVGYNSQT